jgi:hypothetical protein
MGSLQNFKDLVDWGRRLEFILRVLGLLWAWLVGQTVRAIIVSFTHIPDVWHLPIYLLASCLGLMAFVVVMQRGNHKRKVPDSDADEIIKDVKLQGARSILLSFMEARAVELVSQLEALWHHWDNAGEKLIHPLDSRIDSKRPRNTPVRRGWTVMDFGNERRVWCGGSSSWPSGS